MRFRHVDRMESLLPGYEALLRASPLALASCDRPNGAARCAPGKSRFHLELEQFLCHRGAWFGDLRSAPSHSFFLRSAPGEPAPLVEVADESERVEPARAGYA